MAELNYDKLCEVPLFMGLTSTELVEVIEEQGIEVRHFRRGSIIAEEYAHIDNLLIVIKGWVKVTSLPRNRAFRVVEYVEAPMMIEPDRMFGITTSFKSGYIAHTACKVIAITKHTLLRLMEKFTIVRLNYLNAVCLKAQRTDNKLWRGMGNNLLESVRLFILNHSLFPTGRKQLYITMQQLAKEMNKKRQQVSDVLNDLQRKEKLILHRGIIEVPELQLLND